LFKVDHFGHQQVIHVLSPGVTSATVHLCRCNALETRISFLFHCCRGF